MTAPRRRSYATVVFAAIASCAVAQSSPRPDDSMSFSDVMSISFFMAIFFPIFVVLLAFACLRLFHPPEEPTGLETSSSGWSHHKEGLDAAEIAALPLVSYREVKQHRISDGRTDPLECAVCLLEFDDDDDLRLLPTCPHVFHPECIGLWLEKHVTCPLCRASVLDAPVPHLQPPSPQRTASPPDSPPVHEMVVLIGEASGNEEDERTKIQCLARTRQAAGRQALPRSNSMGHERAGGTERFALRLPEHVRLEILMSHRLRHVTSAVASVRVREGSAHDLGQGGSVRSALAKVLSLFVPGAGWKGDDEDKSAKAVGRLAGDAMTRLGEEREKTREAINQ